MYVWDPERDTSMERDNRPMKAAWHANMLQTMFEGFPEMVIDVPLKIQKIVKFGDHLWKVSGGRLSQAPLLPSLKTCLISFTLTEPLDVQSVCDTPSPLSCIAFPTLKCVFFLHCIKISLTAEKFISSFSPHNI